MKLLLTLSCLVLVLGLALCKRGASEFPNPWLGDYELRGYDNAGKLAFTGTLSLRSLNQDHLEGQCTINREEYAPEMLFGKKNGPCDGRVDGMKVNMDMAPLLDDAGLLLEGDLKDGRIAGIWKLDGFVTSDPLGNFEALKVNR